jgi:AcrR family transcriptional regulator
VPGTQKCALAGLKKSKCRNPAVCYLDIADKIKVTYRQYNRIERNAYVDKSSAPKRKTVRQKKILTFGRGDHGHPAGLQNEQRFESLSPTARNILQAAWKIVIQEGFHKLSFARIAQLSGEQRGSISYHFGSKEGLVLALIDAYVHDETINVMESTRRTLSDKDRIKVLFEKLTGIATNRQYVLGFAELFPMTFRNAEMLKSMSALYRWYRHSIRIGLNADTDKPHYEELSTLSHLILGMVDGLSIQHMIEPDDPHILQGIKLIKEMVQDYLEKIGHLPSSKVTVNSPAPDKKTQR